MRDFYYLPLPGPPSPNWTPLRARKYPHVGLCGFEHRASKSPGWVPRVAAGPVTGRCPCRSLPGSPDSPLSQPVPAPRRAPQKELRYLALVHLPQVPKDVQTGRGEMRPHSARAHHAGVSGGRGDPRAPGVTDSCGAPAGPPPTGLVGHVTRGSLGRLGNRSPVSLSHLSTCKELVRRNYHSQNATGQEPRPVKTQGSQGGKRPGSGALSDHCEGTWESGWSCISYGQLGEVTTQDQLSSLRLWSGAKKTPKAPPHSPSRVSRLLDDCDERRWSFYQGGRLCWIREAPKSGLASGRDLEEAGLLKLWSSALSQDLKARKQGDTVMLPLIRAMPQRMLIEWINK